MDVGEAASSSHTRIFEPADARNGLRDTGIFEPDTMDVGIVEHVRVNSVIVSQLVHQ
jgi:hypothetical protein